MAPSKSSARIAGEDRGLVAEVRQVGTCEPGGVARHRGQVDVFRERLPACVHAQDLLAAGKVGWCDDHLPVEAAGTEQRRVEILEAVRGTHHDHLGRFVEAVQLDQQLVESLVVLAVEAAAGAGRAHGVELVDEDDCGRVPARLFEELADPSGTKAGEHLDEGRGALGVELGAGFPRNGFGEQRLAGSGWSVEQDSLRHPGTQLLEALGVTEEVDDLPQLSLCLVHAGHVRPADGRARARLQLRRLDARHVLKRPPEEVDDRAEEDERQPRQGVARQRIQKSPHVRHRASYRQNLSEAEVCR
jgi:hypothetical protein